MEIAVVKDGDAILGIVTLADIIKHVLLADVAAVLAPFVTRAA